MCFFFFFTQSLSSCFIDFLKPSLTFGSHLYWKPTFPLFSLLNILAFRIPFLPSFPLRFLTHLPSFSLSLSPPCILPCPYSLRWRVPVRECEAAITPNLVPWRKHCTSFPLSPSPLCFCRCGISVRKTCKHLRRPKLTLAELFAAAANYVFQRSNRNLKTLDMAQSLLLREFRVHGAAVPALD